jgi:hypothetical protein
MYSRKYINTIEFQATQQTPQLEVKISFQGVSFQIFFRATIIEGWIQGLAQQPMSHKSSRA